ncbi:HdeD family acid-resistance protein [Pseudogemmobacter humi]|uniref:Acid-resistance membrane protein n=1 Tax=Pseudogemmobacter humi TaxID=2483812 RepID=A0A3P5X4V0_9RHOB|nr:DUF308 domain-containing protein [Pseudogemmobacter humi]VDC23189.1 acid-resistance membrane protein [Pseudogemmobacter humi]
MKGSTASFLAGGLAILGGLAALIFPLFASLAVTGLVGGVFLVSGALGLFAAFSDRNLPDRGWLGLFSLLQLVLGIWILANPLAGMISLTVMAGALFLATGLLRVVWAFRIGNLAGRGQGFWLFLLSGVISAALGLWVLIFPLQASPFLLGTLIAIELLSAGAALIALGLALKKIQ